MKNSRLFRVLYRLKNFCGSIADSVSSKSNVVHVRYFAEVAAIESKFSILYTAFRDKEKGQGDKSEFGIKAASSEFMGQNLIFLPFLLPRSPPRLASASIPLSNRL